MTILEHKAYYYYFILQAVNQNGAQEFANMQDIMNTIKGYFHLNEETGSSLERVVSNQTLNAVNGSFVVDFLNSFDNQYPELGIYRGEIDFSLKESILQLLYRISELPASLLLCFGVIIK